MGNVSLTSNTWKKLGYAAWMLALTAVIGGGIAAGIEVFSKGLVVTNLTDLVPWGLWIVIDLSAIALSAGAFSLCAVVYLVGAKEYAPVARTATFIGIIGYSMAMLCLLLDIGRPDRFWHGFVFWNTHSVLWEVTMCVGLYFSVLALETLPIIGGSDWMRRAFPWVAARMRQVHHLSPILALFGLAFSLLHQSSLGATFGVLQARPAWYRPGISVLFIYSAVIGGISLTALASMISARLSRKAAVNDDLLDKLASVIGWALIGYLYFRFWDAFAITYTYQPGRTESLQILTQWPLALNFWLGEILLGIIVPIFLLRRKRLRQNGMWRMAALALVVGGTIAYRWDTIMVGQMIVLTYLPQQIVARYTQYWPSTVELMAGAGIVAYGLMAFTLGARHLDVVKHPQMTTTVIPQPQSEPAMAAN